MFKAKRIFIFVLDSFGIGADENAKMYGDEGSNTLRALFDSGKLNVPHLSSLGLFNIDGCEYGKARDKFDGCICRLSEKSIGKDTTIGHFELSGCIILKPFPTYKNGFPTEIIEEFKRQTGKDVLCNLPYSGTKVIADYGNEHIKTGALIVYTSADSVFQIAAHEDIVPPNELYEYCKIARKILRGEHSVARVIARPFTGTPPFVRTERRRDFSVEPPKKTMLDILSSNGYDVIGVGKINDIFASRGITEYKKTTSNNNGFEVAIQYQKKDFCGICFVNLVDFDMHYGHRNDVEGYTQALNEFDAFLPSFIENMKDDDVLMLCADHGCDPSTPSTDHSREFIPFIAYNKTIVPENFGTVKGFDTLGETVLSLFSLRGEFTEPLELKFK